MKLLITGGAGFLGDRLARALLARGTLAGQAIKRVVLTDIAPPRPDLLVDARVQARTGPLLTHTDALREDNFDGVFHLASAVSDECEADFDLGLRSNLDSTRALLDALRFNVNAGGKAARLVFSSSVAVFGPDPAVPLPSVVADDTLPAPQTSYGTQKLICEHLVADYTRKGYIDGRVGAEDGDRTREHHTRCLATGVHVEAQRVEQGAGAVEVGTQADRKSVV